MPDLELIREILCQILNSTQTIARRFAPVASPDDFLGSEGGLEKLDSICMQLIAIGESVKNLDKVTGGALLPRYPQVGWKRVMGMRDVLTHQYFDLDAEVVFTVCAHHVGVLERTIETMIADLA